METTTSAPHTAEEAKPTFESAWAMIQQLAKSTEESRKAAEESRKRAEEHQKNVDRILQELAESREKSTREIKELNQRMGNMSNSFGATMEMLMTPDLTPKFRKMGYKFTSCTRNKEINEDERTVAEVDVLLENGEYALAVEVKSKPKQGDIKEHLKRMKILRRYADRHGDKRQFLGAIAAPEFSNGMRDKILEAGFFVIEASGEAVNVTVPKGFEPRKW